MRVLIFLTLILALQASYAGPSKSVSHAHDGRTHTHPLPKEGLSHRHGAGSPGVAAHSTNRAGTISSSVVYGEQNSKPEIKSKSSSFIRSRSYQLKDAPLRFNVNLSKGDTSCRAGEADCNVCAVNVQQQFKKAASGQISWRTKPWRFSWPQQYPPNGKRPLDIFDGNAAYALGIPDEHVQGFVRTNSSRFPYAGSHSHKRRGGIFVIRQEPDGKKYLSSLHQTKSRHPSGVHILGKYLVYGENSALVFKDLNSPDQKQDIRLPLSSAGAKANFGGGLGVLRVSKDNYLVVISGPGGQDSRPRFNRFYHLRAVNGRPQSLVYITESASVKPADWPQVLKFSENLSLITECGTGDIYAIHTTGDEKGIKAINGNGYWRLSRLKEKYGSLSLQPLNAFASRQNMTSCNIRAAATVYVNNQNKLEFYCHGYAKDPDGSLFNILGRSSRGADKFYFKAGVVR